MRRFILAAAALMSVSAQAGEIGDMLRNSGDVSRDDVIIEPFPQMRSDHGVTEIGIEHSSCHAPCPVYSFIVKSDGTFRYVGEANVDHQGIYTGTIALGGFNLLAEFIRESNYMSLHYRYTAEVYDLSTTTTMVVMNGQRKFIHSYAGAGPATLWVIEQLIDDLMEEADWNN